MTDVLTDEWLSVHGGDCREVMRSLPAGSIHTVVTSPPYWGLRAYGTEPQQWADGWVGELGLEPRPEAYVEHMVEVFREIRRVLHPSGTAWVNLGDCYADRANRRSDGQSFRPDRADVVPAKTNSIGGEWGLKATDLMGLPWRVAFALQADGWYLRRDIVWHKPNPMPESIRSRPASAHEYLFLLAPRPRYFYDDVAVREPATYDVDRAGAVEGQGAWEAERQPRPSKATRCMPAGWSTEGDHKRVEHPGRPKDARYTNGIVRPGRALRSVWTIPTKPYPDAHFATFPPDLVRPCILAGTSERGACPTCLAPWERIADRELVVLGTEVRSRPAIDHGPGRSATEVGRSVVGSIAHTTVGWAPTCSHYQPDGTRKVWVQPPREMRDDEGDPEPQPEPYEVEVASFSDALPTVPCTVLDPFAGSGTTGVVAQAYSRRAVLIDLHPEYLEQLLRRTVARPLGL